MNKLTWLLFSLAIAGLAGLLLLGIDAEMEGKINKERIRVNGLQTQINKICEAGEQVWNEVQEKNPKLDPGFAINCSDNPDGSKDIMFIGHIPGSFIGKVVESDGKVKPFKYPNPEEE